MPDAMLHVGREPVAFDPFAGPAIEASFPTTEGQREVWVAAALGDDASLAFNESIELRFEGELNEDALIAALHQIIVRHEALRMTFSEDGLLAVVVAPPMDVPVARLDWSHLPDRLERLTSLRAQVVSEPFDLTRGPLIRFVLARLADGEFILFITAHHIACDGWSFGVIASELATLYNAFASGAPAKLRPVDAFSSHARATLDPAAVDEREEAKRYWISQFTGALPVLELPLDRARPALRSYRASREEWVIAPELTRSIAQLSATSGVSVFTTLFAIFGTLLQRLSGQNDLVIGVPTAGQAAAGTPNLVGHLVSMIPIRVGLEPGRRVTELLAELRPVVLDAFDHQSLTFGGLLRELPVARDSRRPPLISATFNLERAMSEADARFEGLRVEIRSVPRLYENFDIFLNAVQRDGTIELECQYNSDVYDRDTIRRWLDVYELLLSGATADCEAQVGDLPVVRAEQLTASSTPFTLPLPSGPALAVHALFESQVAQTPDSVAVVDGECSLTYRELDARANQLARHLRTLGVQRGAFVGLCVERSLDLFVGVFGILKAGGAYVPLDPDYPAERLAFMSADVGMTVLITQESVRREIQLSAPHVLLMDTDAPTIAAQSTAPLDHDQDAGHGESPAYVIFTSGTTGKPNGVVVPHRSVVNLLLSVRQIPGMSERDVVLAITTLSFDIAVSEVILPLTVGARVVLASREVASDGLRLSELIEQGGVTFIDATPATYRLLLAAGWMGGSSLRVICTGEAMPRDLAETLCDHVGEVWNGYGPTETTVWSTFWRVRAPLSRILIGTPVANTNAYVLDERLQPVPIGVTGQLYIGGAGVTSGYHNRPELTRTRFVDDPFSGVAAARMYRTGDLVRMLPDGNIDYLGRNDNQIKLRGYRIELGEIEDALSLLEGVRQAAVTTHENRPGNVRLVAYLVTEGTTPPADGDIRTGLQRSLPDYMVPSLFVRLAKMPLTPSGKIDRKSLPAPTDECIAPSAEFIDARTDSERIVAGLWREVLGIGRVSVRDDFFSLGGHSLLASQILARLRRDHGVVLSFRSFFEAPTVERFSELVDREHATSLPAVVVRIPRRTGGTSAPVSAIQERLWLLEELDATHRSTHNLAAAWRFRGPLNVAVFAEALQDFVARHEALRTSFHFIDGVRRQIVAESATAPFVVLDYSALPQDEREQACTQYMLDDLHTPFDSGVAPLFRAVLFRVGPEEHVLYTLRHASIWDGWSFDIFISEMAECYGARVSGTTPKLVELPIGYADFAEWQREWFAGPEAAEKVAWWREHLAGELPVLELPTDRPRPKVSTFSGDRVSLNFAPDEVAQMRALARAHDVSIYTLLLAAYNLLLYRYTGQADLVVGSPAHARSWVETERVVGPFVNTLVLRTQIAPDMTFAALVAQLRDTTLGALSRSEIPFEMIAERPPVLRALFSMQDARTRPLSAGPLSIEQILEPLRYATNDMMLWVMESATGLRAVLNYSSELFDRETANRFLRHLRTVLRSVLQDSSRLVDALEIIPEEDRVLVLGRADTAPPPTWNVAARVASHMVSNPEAIALQSGRVSLTRAAVVERAQRIAQALRALGVDKGSRVAVCVEDGAVRSLAALGVLWAGGAVALLDPADAAQYNESLVATNAFAAVVVGRASGAPLAQLATLGVLQLGADGRPEGHGSVALHAAPSPEIVGGDPALVLHAPMTSPTPYGVDVSHASLAALVAWVGQRLALNSDDVLVATLSSGTDAAAVELLLPLAFGARLVVATEDTVADGEELSALLTESGATVGIATLATWRSLVSSAWRAGPGFRAVIIDGPVTGFDADAVLDAGCRVFVASSEAVAGTWFGLHELTDARAPELIGSTVVDTAAIILDRQLRPTPVGVWGRLHLSGPVACAAATTPEVAEHVLSVTLDANPVPLLDTGTEARRRDDGTLEHRGTAHATTWIEGGRVALPVVDEVIAAHPGVADVSVRPALDRAGRTRLVAYLVLQPTADVNDSEIRALVRKQLPARMVPAVIVRVDRIPRDATGRVAPDKLPMPFAPTIAALIAPRSESEIRVAAAWTEMLGVPRVSVTDNFFSLGGYSLLCFRLIDRLQSETGVRLSPRSLLLGTLEQVAGALDQARVTASPNDSEPAPMGGTFSRLKTLLRGEK